MKLLTALFIACLLAVVAGCATTPNNPQTAIFAVRGDYNAALSVAVTYASLPFCTTPKTVVVCADRGVVVKLNQAKDVAKAALDNAEQAVNDPAFDQSKAGAVVTAAKYAIIALTTIEAGLAIK